MSLPWEERVVMLSINPDAADRDDVARLAADLMQMNECVSMILLAWNSSDKYEQLHNMDRALSYLVMKFPDSWKG